MSYSSQQLDDLAARSESLLKTLRASRSASAGLPRGRAPESDLLASRAAALGELAFSSSSLSEFSYSRGVRGRTLIAAPVAQPPRSLSEPAADERDAFRDVVRGDAQMSIGGSLFERLRSAFASAARALPECRSMAQGWGDAEPDGSNRGAAAAASNGSIAVFLSDDALFDVLAAVIPTDVTEANLRAGSAAWLAARHSAWARRHAALRVSSDGRPPTPRLQWGDVLDAYLNVCVPAGNAAAEFKKKGAELPPRVPPTAAEPALAAPASTGAAIAVEGEDECVEETGPVPPRHIAVLEEGGRGVGRADVHLAALLGGPVVVGRNVKVESDGRVFAIDANSKKRFPAVLNLGRPPAALQRKAVPVPMMKMGSESTPRPSTAVGELNSMARDGPAAAIDDTAEAPSSGDPLTLTSLRTIDAPATAVVARVAPHAPFALVDMVPFLESTARLHPLTKAALHPAQTLRLFHCFLDAVAGSAPPVPFSDSPHNVRQHPVVSGGAAAHARITAATLPDLLRRRLPLAGLLALAARLGFDPSQIPSVRIDAERCVGERGAARAAEYAVTFADVCDFAAGVFACSAAAVEEATALSQRAVAIARAQAALAETVASSADAADAFRATLGLPPLAGGMLERASILKDPLAAGAAVAKSRGAVSAREFFTSVPVVGAAGVVERISPFPATDFPGGRGEGPPIVASRDGRACAVLFSMVDGWIGPPGTDPFYRTASFDYERYATVVLGAASSLEALETPAPTPKTVTIPPPAPASTPAVVAPASSPSSPMPTTSAPTKPTTAVVAAPAQSIINPATTTNAAAAPTQAIDVPPVGGAHPLPLGSRVFARFRGGKSAYLGVIIGARLARMTTGLSSDSVTYTIRYDDGDEDDGLAAKFVRLVAPDGTAAAPTATTKVVTAAVAEAAASAQMTKSVAVPPAILAPSQSAVISATVIETPQKDSPSVPKTPIPAAPAVASQHTPTPSASVEPVQPETGSVRLSAGAVNEGTVVTAPAEGAPIPVSLDASEKESAASAPAVGAPMLVVDGQPFPAAAADKSVTSLSPPDAAEQTPAASEYIALSSTASPSIPAALPARVNAVVTEKIETASDASMFAPAAPVIEPLSLIALTLPAPRSEGKMDDDAAAAAPPLSSSTKTNQSPSSAPIVSVRAGHRFDMGDDRDATPATTRSVSSSRTHIAFASAEVPGISSTPHHRSSSPRASSLKKR